MKPAYLLDLGVTPYDEACDLQRSLAAAVLHGAIPDTVIMLEHPPVITVGRRTDDGELHVPDGAGVEVRETDRGGKSTYHAPGQLVCYPILDLNRHGRDVKKYCRDLEEAVILTLAEYTLTATRIDGLTGVWLTSPPTKDLLDRSPCVALGDDARVRAERRSRPGAVHELDHGVRARGHVFHDDGARARRRADGRRCPSGRRSGGRRGVRPRARRAARRGRRRALAAAGPREDRAR